MLRARVMLVYDRPSDLSERIAVLAAAQSIACEEMTSNELAARITISRRGTQLEVFPETVAIVLSTTAAEPQSFDEDFLAQERETTIRAWAMLNPCTILSCVNVENNDISANKTSCSVLEKEYGTFCRKELFSLRLPPQSPKHTEIWLRDWSTQAMVVRQTNSPTSEPAGPFWGREALKPGLYAIFLVIGSWCRQIYGSHLDRSLRDLTRKAASRLRMSVGCFTWWREHESHALILAKIERFPPEFLSQTILDEAVLQMFQELRL